MAVHHQNVCALRQSKDLVAEPSVAGVGHYSLPNGQSVSEAVKVISGVLHGQCPEAHIGDGGLAAGLYFQVAAVVAGVGVPEMGEGKVRQLFDHTLDSRRPYHIQVVLARRPVKVLKEKEGKAQEVVAVEVGDEDGLDVRRGDTQPFEVGEDSGRRLEQVAAVQKEGAAVASARIEGVARSEER